MDAALLILAAGEGRRVGGPKAWHLVGGRPWLEHQLQWVAPFDFTSLMVVLAEPPPPEHADVLDAATWTLNPHPELGPFSSLQVGLRALKPRTDPVFVLPVDVPAAGLRTFLMLQEGVFGAAAAVPVLDGRGGHPVLLAARSRMELLRMDPADPEARLDGWLRERASDVRRVETPDRRVLMDLNREEDFQALGLE